MDTNTLILAAERLKQGLLAKATNGEYANEEYKADLQILYADNRIAKMIPPLIHANRSTDDFRRSMQAQFQHYADRRHFIDEQLAPIFEYLHNLETGNDSFTLQLQPDELGEKLGRGGFGMVYKYHHKLLDMDFAVKLFEPMFVSNEENLEGEKRFFREAKILFSLNHENIVRVYDIGRYNGQPYIRMELVNGRTMSDFVNDYGTVSYERSLKPITALLCGLDYAHSLGVIHRDLKPSNYMVTNSGQFKIIDFGISAFLETDKYTSLTKTGESVANGAYTDPELMENPKLRDVRSDIYSVGAIWYYLLVGHAPMGGDLKKQLLASNHATELEANIILKCLSSKLDDRYTSCSELLNLLSPPPVSSTVSMSVPRNAVTEITRRAIFDYLIDRNNDDYNAYVLAVSLPFQEPECVFNYYGRRTEIQFLEKLYNLDSFDSPWDDTLRDEITQHTIRNNDYPYGWVFDDNRFELMSCNDDFFLQFIAQMFHPLFRSEKSDWQSALTEINHLLSFDGYELYESEKISGKSVYSYRYNPQ